MTDTPSNDAPAVPQRCVTDNDIYPRLVALWPELGGGDVQRVSVDISGSDLVRVSVTRLMRETDADKFFTVAQQYRLVKVSPDAFVDESGAIAEPGDGFAHQLRISDGATCVIRDVLRLLEQGDACKVLATAGVDVTDLLEGDLLATRGSAAQGSTTVTIEATHRLQDFADALRRSDLAAYVAKWQHND